MLERQQKTRIKFNGVFFVNIGKCEHTFLSVLNRYNELDKNIMVIYNKNIETMRRLIDDI